MSRRRVITKSLLLTGMLVGAQVLPATATEPACALNGVQPVPVLETAKAHFLRGEYAQFYRIATPFVSDAEARYGEVMGQLPVLFQGGFTDCSTVLQRREVGGMVQEMTLFAVRPPAKSARAAPMRLTAASFMPHKT